MNNKEAIRRKKLYYEGLEKAVAQPFSEQFSIDMDDYLQDLNEDEKKKEMVRLWMEVAAPLNNAIVFIYNNRMISEDIPFLLERDLGITTLMPSGVIFDTLKTLISPTIIDFLSVLPATSVVKEKLFEMTENNDRDGFIALIETARCDTTELSVLCQNCMEGTPKETAYSDEDLPYLLDIIEDASVKESDGNSVRMSRAVKQWQSSTQQLMEDDSDKSFEHFSRDYGTFIQTLFRNNLYMYWNGYDDLLLKERQIIEQILSNPIAQATVARYKEEYKAMRDGVQPFFLTDDFFNSKCDANDTEHLHIKLSVETKGVELFTEFINYVAEKGYIENAPSVKTLFAYRLTGYGRPEKGELPAIVWNGKNNKSYELIYIIRYLCDRGDYKKMRRFFEGCDWVKEKDSSYANSADSEFRRKMSELYPDTCPFK